MLVKNFDNDVNDCDDDDVYGDDVEDDILSGLVERCEVWWYIYIKEYDPLK